MGKHITYDPQTGISQYIEIPEDEEVVEIPKTVMPTEAERIDAIEAALLDILMGG